MPTPGAEDPLTYAQGVLYTHERIELEGRTVIRIRAVELRRGAERWRIDIGASIDDLHLPIRGVANDGKLYIAGPWIGPDGRTRHQLAMVELEGELRLWPVVLSSNPAVSGREPATGRVYAMAVQDEALYVVGAFEAVDGQTRLNAAAFDQEGRLLGWNPAPDRTVHALTVNSDVAYLGGALEGVGVSIRRGLAAFDRSGELRSWAPDVDGTVETLSWSGGSLYAAGTFSQVDGQPRQGLAAFGPDGELLGWAPRIECACELGRRGSRYPAIAAIEVRDGVVYLAGALSAVDDQPRSLLAAVGTDGRVLPWRPNLDGGQVTDIVATTENIYAVGDFTSVDGQPRLGLAAFDADGSLTRWSPTLAPQPNGPSVRKLLVRDDTVYVGGDFKWASRTPRNGAAAFDLAGQLLNWRPSPGPISSMAAGHDGPIIFGWSSAQRGPPWPFMKRPTRGSGWVGDRRSTSPGVRPCGPSPSTGSAGAHSWAVTSKRVNGRPQGNLTVVALP